MSPADILLLLVAILPFLSFTRFFDISAKTLPILFIITLFLLNRSLPETGVSLTLLFFDKDIFLQLGIDKAAIKPLFFLGLIWMLYMSYIRRFLAFKKIHNSNALKIFSLLAIAVTNLTIISANLLTLLFFYYFLVIIRYSFLKRFIFKKDDSSSYLLEMLLYLEAVLLFLAIFLTYKIVGDISFSHAIITSLSEDLLKYQVLLMIYVIAFFLSFFIPTYLLIRSVNIEPIITYALFFLASAFSVGYIFLKLLTTIFLPDETALTALQSHFIFCQYFFLALITLVSIVFITSRSLKSSFLYLLFQQMLMATFISIIFFLYKPTLLFLPFISFALSLSLILFPLSNLTLYLTKAESKNIQGLFYHFKISGTFLILGIISLLGLAPVVSAVEKFILISIILDQKLFVCALTLVINFLAVLFFAWKIIVPLFIKNANKGISKPDSQLAQKIDKDSSFIIAMLIIAIAMIALAGVYILH